MDNEALAKLIYNGLDPNIDAHWTKKGEPSMEAVEALVGDDKVTRANVVEAVGDYDRTEAFHQNPAPRAPVTIQEAEIMAAQAAAIPSIEEDLGDEIDPPEDGPAEPLPADAEKAARTRGPMTIPDLSPKRNIENRERFKAGIQALLDMAAPMRGKPGSIVELELALRSAQTEMQDLRL